MLNRPIFGIQTCDATKLGIVRHERKIVRECNRGDLQVVRTDHLTPRFEVVTNLCVFSRRRIVEGKRYEGSERAFNSRQAVGAFSVLLSSMQKLGPHDRADGDVCGRRCSQSSFNRRSAVLQIEDPGIRIDKIAHHHDSRGCIGSSGETSNASPAKLPAVASKYPGGYPSESVWAAARCWAFWSAERTACSNNVAVSGSTRWSTLSSSRASELIEVTLSENESSPQMQLNYGPGDTSGQMQPIVVANNSQLTNDK